MTPLTSLAIVAGGGAFPPLVAGALRDGGTRVFVVHLEGHSDPFGGFESMTARPEQLGRIFAVLRGEGIADLVLIGRMTRPRIRDLRPDLFTLRQIPKILWQLAFGGDDALLRSVRGMLERQGFRVHAAHDFVTGLTAPAGVFSKAAPDPGQLADIRLGVEEARAHGARDAGQAVVVMDGHILGRETAAGTNALICSRGEKGSILVKTAKPQQDRALDLPSIGPETVRLCAESGFAGIAVEAGETLVADRDEVIKLADRHGLFLIGVT